MPSWHSTVPCTPRSISPSRKAPQASRSEARVAERPRRLPGQEKKEPHRGCPVHPQPSGAHRPTSAPASGPVQRPQTAQPHDGKSQNRSQRRVIERSTQRRSRQSEQHHRGDGLLAMSGHSKVSRRDVRAMCRTRTPSRAGRSPYHSEPSIESLKRNTLSWQRNPNSLITPGDRHDIRYSSNIPPVDIGGALGRLAMA